MGRTKELVPVHSTEDCFVSNTKWNRDCCATTVSELSLAWAVFKPHQVKLKDFLTTLLFVLTTAHLPLCTFSATGL